MAIRNVFNKIFFNTKAAATTQPTLAPGEPLVHGNEFKVGGPSGTITAANKVHTHSVSDLSDKVANSNLANMTGPSIKGRISGTGAPTDLSVAQARNMLNMIGTGGQAYYIANTGQPEITPGFILERGRFANSTADLNAERAIVVSMQQVFNTWTRFNLGTVAGEENSWEYLPSTDQIRCTVNSTGHIGFISLEKYDNYIHRARLTSNHGDDDFIRLVIAAKFDSNNILHVLHVCRATSNTRTTSYRILYSYGQNNTAPINVLIAEGTHLAPIANTNWNAQPNGTTVEVIREGNIVKTKCSQWNSTVIDNNTELTVNLATDSRLNVFLGPQSYGYSCQSQPNSTYSNITFISSGTSIIDLRNGDTWTYINGSWQNNPGNFALGTLYGKLLYSPNIGKMFFCRSMDDIWDIRLHP